MKKNSLKIILSLIYCLLLGIVIYREFIRYSENSFIFIILSIVLFVFHLAILIAPKKTFDICWKLYEKSKSIYDFDYEYGYKRVKKVGFGLLVGAYIFLGISAIFVF